MQKATDLFTRLLSQRIYFAPRRNKKSILKIQPHYVVVPCLRFAKSIEYRDDHVLEERTRAVKGLGATLVWAAHVCDVVGLEMNACLTADR